MRLTVLMPLYNEEKTAREIITMVLNLDLELQLIIINNGSTDHTGKIIQEFASQPNVRILDQKRNIGKGNAVVAGLPLAVGKYTVIQDGDLEYNPGDLIRMLEVAEQKDALAVFGSRTRNPESGVSYSRYLWGGKLLTAIANLLYGVGITDESTCYKLIRTDIMKAMRLECRRFEFCPEVVAKLGRSNITIHEIPIQYQPRKFYEGKKIRWHDGLEAIWTLLKYRFKSVPELPIEKQK
ncbi:MAG: glycosyltransferase family 2 protein [Candidatus Zixiibacteriota bacterium]|nr:MAG: glycosyltransferase family 2 protein [candidate division Zixibacteria bacterium]